MKANHENLYDIENKRGMNMNYLQRAFAYVKRRMAKTILLMITFFLIGNLVILGLGISQAAENAKIMTRKSMRAVVSYEVDYNKYYEYVDSLTDQDEIEAAYRNWPKLSAQVASELSKDQRVKAFNYMINRPAYSINFENVPLGNENEKSNGSYTDDNGNEIQYRDPNIMLYANYYPNMIEMEDGTFTLESGKYFTQSDIDSAAKVVCITKELAEQNNLHVGDTINLSTMDPSSLKNMENEGQDVGALTLDLEICGIYSTVKEMDTSDERFKWASPYESPKNIVLLPMTTLINCTQAINSVQRTLHPDWYTDEDFERLQDQEIQPTTVVYLLDDPLNVEAFVSEHEGELSDYTKLNANDETFKKLARPLDTMSFFSNIVVWIVVINAVVIISLVTALTLKTREYEIGVLLAMGVSKIKVVMQLFMELFAIAIIGFTLAVASGSLMAGKVGDQVLNYQTASDAQSDTPDQYEDTYYYSDYGFGSSDYFTRISQEQMLAQYHVSVSPLLIGEIYLLGTVVVLVSIVIPSFMIMRLNPKQILLEQN